MLKIGWATRDLTPTRPAMLMGQMHPRVATSALDPITVTAWAVEDVVFVSCDLALITEENQQDVWALLPPEIPAKNVILSATHTHESLVLVEGPYAHPGGNVMTTAECRTWAAERIAGAIVEAWRARTPRRVGRAFGHAVVGHNRYAVYADATGQMYGQTNRPDFRAFGGYEDHSVDLFFTWEPAWRWPFPARPKWTNMPNSFPLITGTRSEWNYAGVLARSSKCSDGAPPPVINHHTF